MPPLSEADVRPKLDHLLSLLATANHAPGGQSFSPAAEAFQDLVEIPGFVSLGERHASELINTLLQTVATQLRPKRPEVRTPVLRLLPSRGFVHGATMLNGQPANLFWFEEEKCGLLLLILPNKSVQMVRLTVWDPPPQMPPLAGGPVGRA